MAWSVVWAGVVVVATIACFHAWPVQRRFRLLCIVFVLGMVGMGWSLQRVACTHDAAQERLAVIVLGMYLYSFWIFGMFAPLYSLADRGFSLTILSDFFVAGCPPRTRAQIKQAYAGGQGMQYVKAKRMAQLLHGGFVQQKDHQSYAATSLGRWIGQAALQLYALYRFQEVG